MSDSFKTYTVAAKTVESSTISSFLLMPETGVLPDFRPGEYLIFELPCGSNGTVIRREYSISGLIDGALRVSIKREPAAAEYLPGLGSNYFHDQLNVGSKLRVAGPYGQFQLDRASPRHAVLLSGGVGLTPMVAMARDLSADGKGFTFIHACEDGAVHAMGAEVRALAKAHKSMSTHFCYRLPRHADKPGRDYDSKGFLTAGTLQGLLSLTDQDFYLCGPGPFMQAIYDILQDLGVRDDRIRYESFGPATLLRSRASAPTPPPPILRAGGDRHTSMVHFAKSGLRVAWDPSLHNLLEFAEEQGLMPDYSCRAGTCESCKTHLIAGSTEYLFEPFQKPTDGSILLCCSVPKEDITIGL